MTLHPAFARYLEDLNVLIAEAQRNGVQPTPESARAALAGLNQFALPAVQLAEVRDAAVTYQPDADAVASGDPDTLSIPVRIYVPEHYAKSDAVFFVHGGGHMAGDLDVYDFSARRTAQATGMIVVSVDYRRSPEHPYPAGLTDTYQVLKHLDQVLDGYETTGKIHAVADSGGAAVVSSIAMRTVAGEWSSPIERQVLIYPSLDYTMSGQSIQDYGTGYFLEAQRVHWYFENYLPAGVDWKAVSPVFGPFSADMPETLVIAAEYDPLISEAETYVNEVNNAGSKATLVVAPGMIHAYTFFESMVTEEVENTYRMIGDFLRTGTASWN